MLSTPLIHRFLSSLIFTDVVETVILLFLVRFILKDWALRTSRIIFAGLYASFSTIPYVWFVFPFLMAWSSHTALFCSELFAFVVEAVFYRAFLKLSWKQVFFLSFVCNLASYLLGPFLRAHGVWIYW